MRWATLRCTREEVNKAGRLLAQAGSSDDVSDSALDAISNWRSCHGWPLNIFKVYLLEKSKQVDEKCLVAQRLKRLSSIAIKLQRFPQMKLSQMQDIAGCRAIVGTVADVNKLVKKYKRSDIKHELVHEDDYILNPRPSGYRGVHLIYRYFSDKNTTYNDLKVEVQLRSVLQHLWATAVETVGTFTQQALKSSKGKEEWLRFFELMGSEIALREGTETIPNTPNTRAELRDQIKFYEDSLQVASHLQLYAASLRLPEKAGKMKGAKFFLLELDPDPFDPRLRITGYGSRELEKASADYMTVERSALAGGKDAVLVSVDSIKALKKAFPNYYLDTHRFIQVVKRAIARKGDPRQRSFNFSEESAARGAAQHADTV